MIRTNRKAMVRADAGRWNSADKPERCPIAPAKCHQLRGAEAGIRASPER